MQSNPTLPSNHLALQPDRNPGQVSSAAVKRPPLAQDSEAKRIRKVNAAELILPQNPIPNPNTLALTLLYTLILTLMYT